MNWKEYRKIIESTPYTDGLKYAPVIAALRPHYIPEGVISLESTDAQIIRIPETTVNRFGNTVPVTAIGRNAFRSSDEITDIVIPPCVSAVYQGAFAGCRSLERITIPKAVKRIPQGTFDNCTALTDIYYEGSKEEWEAIEIVSHKREVEYGELQSGSPVCEKTAERLIHVSGNEPVFSANIHFLCII